MLAIRHPRWVAGLLLGDWAAKCYQSRSNCAVMPVEEVGLDSCVWPFKAWIIIGGTQAWLEGVVRIFQLRGQEHRASREGVRLFNIEWQSWVGIQRLELGPCAAVLVGASLRF